MTELAPDEMFWRRSTVLEHSGLSASEMYRRINEGTFPAARHYRGNAKKGVFWLSSEVKNWQRNELLGDPQEWGIPKC